MEITRAEFVRSLTSYQSFPHRGLPEIAFAGRSNVGKSSLLNSLTRRKGLAKVSGVPGKTRLINVFLINDSLHFIDLPGYGYARASKTEQQGWGDMMERYFRDSRALRLTLHLVDIRHEPTRDDVTMNEYLRGTSQPFLVVATKTDKVSRAQRNNALQLICRTLSVQPWQVVAYSSETGEGRPELLKRIEQAAFAKTQDAQPEEDADAIR